MREPQVGDVIYDIEYRNVLDTVFNFIDKNKDHKDMPDDILYDIPYRIKMYIKCSL